MILKGENLSTRGSHQLLTTRNLDPLHKQTDNLSQIGYQSANIDDRSKIEGTAGNSDISEIKYDRNSLNAD